MLESSFNSQINVALNMCDRAHAKVSQHVNHVQKHVGQHITFAQSQPCRQPPWGKALV